MKRRRFELRVSSFRCEVSSFEFQISSFKFQVSVSSLEFGVWSLEFRAKAIATPLRTQRDDPKRSEGAQCRRHDIRKPRTEVRGIRKKQSNTALPQALE